MRFKITFTHNLHMQGATISVVRVTARSEHEARQMARWGEINKHPGRTMSIKVEKTR